MSERPDDRRDDELRALLEDAVSDVDPPPALHHIQSRTSAKVTPMNSKRPWILTAVGAVAATAATLVVVTVLADDPVETAGPAGSPSASATPEPTAEPTPGPSQEPTQEPTDDPTDTPGTDASPPPPGAVVTTPVYFVGETPAGTRLFREFQRLEKGFNEAGQVQAALSAAVAGSASDPDYRSDWPDGTSVRGVEATEEGADPGVARIDLSGPGGLRDRPVGMSPEAATMAVQQLVHTAHAVLQRRVPVEFEVDGQKVDTLLGVPVAEQAVAGDPMEVQAPVWVITPQNGDTVSRTFEVEGRGAFFEANVSWQLLRDGKVVKDGFTTAEEGMTLSPYSFEVTADPGEYVLRVYDADMSGGEGNGEAEDTKRIIVE